MHHSFQRCWECLFLLLGSHRGCHLLNHLVHGASQHSQPPEAFQPPPERPQGLPLLITFPRGCPSINHYWGYPTCLLDGHRDLYPLSQWVDPVSTTAGGAPTAFWAAARAAIFLSSLPEGARGIHCCHHHLLGSQRCCSLLISFSRGYPSIHHHWGDPTHPLGGHMDGHLLATSPRKCLSSSCCCWGCPKCSQSSSRRSSSVPSTQRGVSQCYCRWGRFIHILGDYGCCHLLVLPPIGNPAHTAIGYVLSTYRVARRATSIMYSSTGGGSLSTVFWVATGVALFLYISIVTFPAPSSRGSIRAATGTSPSHRSSDGTAQHPTPLGLPTCLLGSHRDCAPAFTAARKASTVY